MSGVIRYFNASTGADIRVSPANPLPVGGGVASGVADSGNPVKIAGVYTNPLSGVSLSTGQRGNLSISLRGAALIAASGSTVNPASNTRQNITITDNAGNDSNLAVAAYVYNGTSADQIAKASAVSRIVSSANTNNATSAKASAGNVHTITAYNANATVRYLKLYNKATAPTVGTDTPVLTIPLPPTSVTHLEFGLGQYFSTGIGYGLVTGSADADNTAVGAGDILGLNIAYS